MDDRVKVVDVELGEPAEPVQCQGYSALLVLARLHGVPIGYIKLPVIDGYCSAATIRKAILKQYSWSILCHFMEDRLASTDRKGQWRLSDLSQVPHPAQPHCLPLVTVAVCTRNRTEDLKLCLDSLTCLEYPNLDLLVIDNAPDSDTTFELVTNLYPHVRYIREPRPGLDWARNRAIHEARGDLIAYTDDDVIVDRRWINAIADVFAEDPEVMAVTGLVVPYELETEAQILFEMRGGFQRGFQRTWSRGTQYKGRIPYGTGQFGTGANMAYRLSLFDKIGCFDPALDVGTVTHGGGDLEMFFRVIKEGYTLVYEPAAIVRHRHRRTYEQLQNQLHNNSIGLYSYLTRSALAYPGERLPILRFGLWWLWWGNIRRLLISLWHPQRFPRDLIWAELKGSILGLTRYPRARRSADRIASTYPGNPTAVSRSSTPLKTGPTALYPEAVGIRTLELGEAITPIEDVDAFQTVQIYVTWKGCPLGHMMIPNQGHSISASLLRRSLVTYFGHKLLTLDYPMAEGSFHTQAYPVLGHFLPEEQESRSYLPADVSVAVAVATYDRPDDLRQCLRSLVNQQTSRKVDIIVVDNHPDSGLTPPVVSEFPQVRLVNESRTGLSYARNAGIINSVADVVIATDDDVIAPSDWLEKLIAPFVRSDVMVVTGNVLPLELQTPAQQLFENYGGLGRGYEYREFGAEWFESFKRHTVPTWNLGATANAAFRATIFSHPKIGLMEEILGPGTPTGVGEDTFLFYQVLRAGYTVVYEPSAYVWHKHRQQMRGVLKQLYNYSKGHIAYHLLTLIRYHDFRVLATLGYHLPRYRLHQIYRWTRARLRGRQSYPLVRILCEIAGNLAGPRGLWQSYRRVKRLGRSRHLESATPEGLDLEKSTAILCNDTFYRGAKS